MSKSYLEKKEFILACGSRGEIQDDEADSLTRKLDDHVFQPHTGSKEWEQEVLKDYKPWKPNLSDVLPLATSLWLHNFSKLHYQ